MQNTSIFPGSPEQKTDRLSRLIERWRREVTLLRQTFYRCRELSVTELSSILRCSPSAASQLVSRHPRLLYRRRQGRHVYVSLR